MSRESDLPIVTICLVDCLFIVIGCFDTGFFCKFSYINATFFTHSSLPTACQRILSRDNRWVLPGIKFRGIAVHIF